MIAMVLTFLLKAFTDSDWASNKGTRKSVSACCLMNDCLLNSESGNQGLLRYPQLKLKRMQQPQEHVMLCSFLDAFHCCWKLKYSSNFL